MYRRRLLPFAPAVVAPNRPELLQIIVRQSNYALKTLEPGVTNRMRKENVIKSQGTFRENELTAT